MDSSTETNRESIKYVDDNDQSVDDSLENLSEQTHPIIAVLPSMKSIIYGYVLSMWDNIVGPKAVYVWKTESKPLVEKGTKTDVTKEIPSLYSGHNDNEIIEDEVRNKSCVVKLTDVTKYVAEHSISVGDVNKFGQKHVTSWLTAPHQNIAFLSVRFPLEEIYPDVPCSLSCITYYGERHKLRKYLELSLSQMQIIANKISLLFRKEGLVGIKRVTDDLLRLTNTISSLMTANLSVCIPEHPPETPVGRHLAALMLTSHLQTRCSTLVIASSLTAANKVIRWLSQFSTEKHLPLSCLCLSEKKCLYSNGPYIQAVIRDSRGEVDLPTSSMLCAGIPLTIIDLTKHTVRQFASSATQKRICIQALHTDLVDLYSGCKGIGAISRSIFRPVEVIAPLIKNFLQEWSCLAECEPLIRREYLNTFKQSLYYNALSVSVFIRNKCQGIKYDEKSDAEQDFKPDIILREIKSVLQLNESDLKLLLAKAESFDPGITSFVFR